MKNMILISVNFTAIYLSSKQRQRNTYSVQVVHQKKDSLLMMIN